MADYDLILRNERLLSPGRSPTVRFDTEALEAATDLQEFLCFKLGLSSISQSTIVRMVLRVGIAEMQQDQPMSKAASRNQVRVPVEMHTDLINLGKVSPLAHIAFRRGLSALLDEADTFYQEKLDAKS